MDIVQKISKLISYLLPKVKNAGRQSFALSTKVFKTSATLSITTYKTLRQTSVFLLKASNQTIHYFTHHPFINKAAAFYQRLNKKVIRLSNQLSRSIKKTRAYKKAVLYAQLIRLDKPIGIFLLLWPTLIALWIAAEGWPNPLVLFVFIIGVILMRSAGCAINDYADRDIDRKVARTKQRPLAAGKISETEALLVFISLSLAAFSLVLLMNELTIWMSLGGIVLAVSYPFMKRYHYLPQVHLGAAFGWAAPMAYTAQANEITSITWLIFLATILWATAYDTMYAMVDYDDDIKIGVKSTAILFGNQDKIIIAAIQILLIFNLLLIGHRAELSGFYYLGVAAASLFAAYQQFLIKDREPALCFQAFLNNNWFGLILFIGVFLDYQFSNVI